TGVDVAAAEARASRAAPLGGLDAGGDAAVPFSREWLEERLSVSGEALARRARGRVAASLAPLPWAPLRVPATPVTTREGVRSTAWVEATLSRLTLREKVAQMVMPWIPGGELNASEARRARTLVVEAKVGGLIVGKGDAVRTAAWLNHLRRSADVPLLVGGGLEWGPGTRLVGGTVLPVNMASAAAGGPELAYEAGRITAREARAAGVHMAFAPVADVNVNAANPVINTRSYGADPIDVVYWYASYGEVALAEGMLTVGMHLYVIGDMQNVYLLTI